MWVEFFLFLFLLAFIYDIFILAVDFFHFVLEVLDNVIDVSLSFADTLSVVLYELKHDFHHIVFAFGLVNVIVGFDFDNTFVVVVFFFEVDHFDEIWLI